MSEDKMLELQMQVRRNQQDMLDYVRELDGWEEEMKRKEEQLKQQPIPKNEVNLNSLGIRLSLIDWEG